MFRVALVLLVLLSAPLCFAKYEIDGGFEYGEGLVEVVDFEYDDEGEVVGIYWRLLEGGYVSSIVVKAGTTIEEIVLNPPISDDEVHYTASPTDQALSYIQWCGEPTAVELSTLIVGIGREFGAIPALAVVVVLVSLTYFIIKRISKWNK